MIGMIVRDQQRIETLGILSMHGESLLNLDPADPRVEKEPDTIRLDIDAISVAAGLERDDFHGDILLQESLLAGGTNRTGGGGGS